MVRHPHFTQPIFVRFPRPAVLERPRGHRAVPARAPSCPSPTRWRGSSAGSTAGSSPDAVRALVDGRREDDVRRALGATRRERPDDVLAFFTACLGRRVGGEVVAPPAARSVRRGDAAYDSYQVAGSPLNSLAHYAFGAILYS